MKRQQEGSHLQTKERSHRGNSPSSTLNLGFQHPVLWENKFYCLNHPACGMLWLFVMAARQTKATMNHQKVFFCINLTSLPSLIFHTLSTSATLAFNFLSSRSLLILLLLLRMFFLQITLYSSDFTSNLPLLCITLTPPLAPQLDKPSFDVLSWVGSWSYRRWLAPREGV